jgi:hypothetical protein
MAVFWVAAPCSLEEVNFYQTTRRHPEDSHLQFKLSSEGGDSGSKKYKRGCGGVYGGSGGVCVWQESGVRRSVFCWFILQESGFSRCKDFFISDLLYKDIL